MASIKSHQAISPHKSCVRFDGWTPAAAGASLQPDGSTAGRPAVLGWAAAGDSLATPP